MTKWELIDTAPKDGTKILAIRLTRNGCAMHQIYWGEYFGKELWRGWPRTYGSPPPTHWTILDLPSNNTEAEK